LKSLLTSTVAERGLTSRSTANSDWRNDMSYYGLTADRASCGETGRNFGVPCSGASLSLRSCPDCIGGLTQLSD
jgi:hypothetical protein